MARLIELTGKISPSDPVPGAPESPFLGPLVGGESGNVVLLKQSIEYAIPGRVRTGLEVEKRVS